MSNNEYKDCPYCAEKIKVAAIKCRYCDSMLNEDDNIDSSETTIDKDGNHKQTRSDTSMVLSDDIGSEAIITDISQLRLQLTNILESNREFRFAILQKENNVLKYIQAQKLPELSLMRKASAHQARLQRGFVLEYQDGSLDEHYECKNDNLDSEAIIRVFQLYFNNDSRWQGEYVWVKILV